MVVENFKFRKWFIVITYITKTQIRLQTSSSVYTTQYNIVHSFIQTKLFWSFFLIYYNMGYFELIF